MSTSRRFRLFTHNSQILTDSFYGSVTNYSRTRIVHETGMYSSRHFAKNAAKKWAETSQSKKAKSLETGKGQ